MSQPPPPPPLNEEDIGAILTADVIEKVNAGAQLTYALFHRDVEWWNGQPNSLMKAYMRACEAYGVTSARRVRP